MNKTKIGIELIFLIGIISFLIPLTSADVCIGQNCNITISLNVTNAINITILYPEARAYGLAVTQINYVLTGGAFPNMCWYSKNGGATNSTPVSAGTNFSGVTSAEGLQTWIVYCNDTLSTSSKSVTFRIDTISPSAQSGGAGGTSPNNKTRTPTSPTNFTVNASDINGSGIQNITLIITNETGATINETTIDTGGALSGFWGFMYNLWYEGIYKWVFKVVDVVGNIFTTEENIIIFDTSNPTGSIVFPTNTSYNYQITTMNFIITEPNASNCWYNVGGSDIPIICGNNATGLASVEGGNTWKFWVNNTAGFINESRVTFTQDTGIPYISINAPVPLVYYTNLSVLVDITANDNTTAINRIWWNVDGGSNVTYTIPAYSTFTEGSHLLRAYANDSAGNINSTSVVFLVDLTPPAITLNDIGVFSAQAFPVFHNFTWFISDPNITTCWYDIEYVFKNPHHFVTTNQSVNCSLGIATFNVSDEGSHILTLYGKTGDGFISSASKSAYALYHTYTQSASTSVTTEGSVVNFALDVDETQYTTTTAVLVYDGIEYPIDSFNQHQDAIHFDKALTIPDTAGTLAGRNVTWYWKYNIAVLSQNFSTANEYQKVFAVDVDDCSVYNETILHYDLNDEGLDTGLNISLNPLVEADVQITSLGDENIFWQFHKIWNATSGSICIPAGLLSHTSYRFDATISYIADTYAEEFWYVVNSRLINGDNKLDKFTNRNITLRDLLLDDSQTFLFKYYNEKFLTQAGSIVLVYRKYIGQGTFKEVERCLLDDNGECHLHLVEEDVIYKFIVTTNGEKDFESGVYNAKCVETPCLITLQKGAEAGVWDTTMNNLPEGSYNLATNETTRIVTLTFNLNETGEMQLDVFVYSNVVNSPDVLVDSQSVTAKEGSVSVEIPLSYGNKTYYAVVRHNTGFVTSSWIDLSESGYHYFGNLGLFLGALLVLSLGLIAISSGGWTIAFLVFGLLIASITKLIDMDVYLIMFVLSAGGLIIWKLASRRSL